MFGRIFGKGNPEENVIVKMMSIAKTFGIDIPAIIEKKMPELVQQAKEYQEKLGHPLFLSIALDDSQEHFVLALWKFTEGGADVIQRYALTDPVALFSQLQNDLKNIQNDTAAYNAQPIAIDRPATDDTTSGNGDNSPEVSGTDTGTGE